MILKSKPLFFFPLKTRFKTTPKTRTKKGSALVQSSLRVLECRLLWGSRNLVGIAIQLSDSEQEKLLVGYSMLISPEKFDFGVE